VKNSENEVKKFVEGEIPTYGIMGGEKCSALRVVAEDV
jgi:hypothetical protein